MAVFLLELPSLSPTMEKGTITEWKVKEGDFVNVDDIIASISTDKSTVDFEALDEGFLQKILLAEKIEGQVGQAIAIFSEKKDEDWQTLYKEIIAKKTEEKKEEKNLPQKEEKKSKKESFQGNFNLSTVLVSNPPKKVAEPKEILGINKDVRVSPLAKKLAEEKNINLSAIKTPHNERITKEDIEKLPNNYGHTLLERKSLVGFVERAKKPFDDLTISQMRKSISDRMVQASFGVPIFYLTVEVNMNKLIDLRTQLNLDETNHIKISFNDFIVKAVALALKIHPEVNAAFQDDIIKKFNDVDISIAVSIPDGLITPIVRSADTKGLLTISKEVKSLVVKAKSDKLVLEEYQGGSFTISNLGMFKVDEFTAILNPPQSGILAVGGINKKLQLSNGQIVENSYTKLTLTADHRL